MSNPPIIKTFRADSMSAALEMIRREMGGDAVILNTKQIEPKAGLLRRGGRPEVEITAGTNIHVDPPRVRPDHANQPAGTSEPQSHFVPAAAMPSQAPVPDQAMNSRLAAIESALEQLTRRARWSGPLAGFESFAEQLRIIGLPENHIPEWIDRLQSELDSTEAADSDVQYRWLRNRISELVSRSGRIRLMPQQRTVVALVGATGVGKTTTIAKLAGNFRLHDQIRLGLITVDTFRIAAVEQLRTYAEIIELPMQVVTNTREMRKATDAFAKKDLVLIDTAGRSPRDAEQMTDLANLLSEAAVTETHLCLSATTDSVALKTTVERFRQVNPTSLLLTKLDEVDSIGHLLPTLEQTSLPFSYLTNGQHVPADIEAASPQKLTDRLFAPLASASSFLQTEEVTT